MRRIIFIHTILNSKLPKIGRIRGFICIILFSCQKMY